MNLLRFSMDFTKISKTALLLKIHIFSQAPGKVLELTTMPLVRVKHPGKKEGDAIGSSAMEGGAARWNWAAPAAPLAGEVEGEGVGLTRARFVCLVGGEGLPAVVDSGPRSQPSLERLLRRVERRRLRARTLRGSRVIVGRGR
jgi:hypothetical protein